jgi:DNA topoisomerase-2
MQDHDGSHIKGLLINFIHSFWPSLLKVPSFMVEFTTPIIRVSIINSVYCIFDNENTKLYILLNIRSLLDIISSIYIKKRFSFSVFLMRHIYLSLQASHSNGTKLSFYSMPEYETWRERLGNNANGWKIKYYKVCCCKHEEPLFLRL